MSPFLQRPSESVEDTIRLLQQELAETNREVMALTVELEKRVEERTAALRVAQLELERKNASLESANRELESFSYSVSHDLRAPLRHLMGFAQALQEDCGPSLDDSAKQYISSIVRSADRMNELIDGLLAFAHTGQLPLQCAQVRFEPLVRQVIAEMTPDLAGRNIEWVVQSLPEVQGDQRLLRQVWINLISNAVKYTRQKDPARIQIGCTRHPSREWEFFVRDNGAGFDMAHAAKLFGVFQRLHSREEFEGVGMGLANVRRIIERHGGRTWADAQPGIGATFYFSLPLK
jgi:light-regulated signal transduction histidine kinase (bacteriophytochrome)